MAKFVEEFLSSKGWTVEKLGNDTGLSKEMLENLNAKTAEEITAEELDLIGDVFNIRSEDLASTFFEMEKDAMLKELETIFEKHGYNTDEIGLELFDGESIRIGMHYDNITDLMDSVNTETKRFIANIHPSANWLVIEEY
ncbi:helix-turn-helix domain-containing protein [Listeria seeligeri]|uniref:helix-turn-helix domain-containing protein n=1 Tax=Listeria seeligeri TaxID=1640 RepID=UPI0010EC581D|nr:helix-turn-helix domain-containing protein [Listeria seeligeri]